jgi:hypothetical protein
MRTYTIEQQFDNFIVNLSYSLGSREPSKIQAILEGVFNLGAERVMLANSELVKNWTFERIIWDQQPDAVVDYIHNRTRFDQIFCQTLAQAEQVVKNMEQMDIYWALQKDYT